MLGRILKRLFGGERAIDRILREIAEESATEQAYYDHLLYGPLNPRTTETLRKYLRGETDAESVESALKGDAENVRAALRGRR